MGDHIDKKKNPAKRHKRVFGEGQDLNVQRHRRVSFKAYVQRLEEDFEDDLLEQDLVDDNLDE